jgi:transposase-like protein
MPRRRVYTSREKLQILDQIAERQDAGDSLRACCRDLEVQPSQIRRWKEVRDELSHPDALHRHSLHTGRPSNLVDHELELKRWFFELREQGFMVSVRLITLKACELSAEFRRKGTRAKDMAVRRFLARNKIVLRAVTHECQRPPAAVRQEALDFVRSVRPKMIGRNRSDAFILNMDQTPIFLICPLEGLLIWREREQ